MKLLQASFSQSFLKIIFQVGGGILASSSIMYVKAVLTYIKEDEARNPLPHQAQKINLGNGC